LLPGLFRVDQLNVLDGLLHGCELKVVRHAFIVCEPRLPYTPILARNSEEIACSPRKPLNATG
jgi:hypothetical protein